MIVCLMQCRVESLLQRLILTCCSPTHTFSRPTSSSSFTSRSMQLKIHNFHFAILLFQLRSSALVCCTKMAKYRFSNIAMEILHWRISYISQNFYLSLLVFCLVKQQKWNLTMEISIMFFHQFRFLMKSALYRFVISSPEKLALL